MTPNLESAPSVAAQLPLPLCLALALSPLPVPHGPSVSYQDHAPLGASEPGGGFGSLHDHRICPPALGWALPKEVSFILSQCLIDAPHLLLPILSVAVSPGNLEETFTPSVLAPQDAYQPAGEGQDTFPPVSPQVTWAAAPTALGPIPRTSCSILSSPAATSIPEDA